MHDITKRRKSGVQAKLGGEVNYQEIEGAGRGKVEVEVESGGKAKTCTPSPRERKREAENGGATRGWTAETSTGFLRHSLPL